MNLHSTLQNKEPIPHGLFYMWRCVIAIAHIDGEVSKEEEEYIRFTISKLQEQFDMSDEQVKILENDINESQSITDLFKHINEPSYRANVLHFCRILAYKDGILSPSEEEILKKLHIEVMDNIDFQRVRAEVQENVAHEIALHDIAVNVTKTSGLGPVFRWMYSLLLFLGIDIGEEDYTKKSNKKSLDDYKKQHNECVAYELNILKNLDFKDIRTPYIGENLIEEYNGEYHYKASANESVTIKLSKGQLEKLEELRANRSKALDVVLSENDTIYN